MERKQKRIEKSVERPVAVLFFVVSKKKILKENLSILKIYKGKFPFRVMHISTERFNFFISGFSLKRPSAAFCQTTTRT